ncbi:hypothetical protein BO78DRAFT_473056 [Aspergillus sclerotiicarbonarius CBS 121057]|uniref:NACHT domain-containing protein n=1 Tax=Aspergillus sclerotiicarbonarius (strain CBS 121057 / IBT 28362) TaxID=1448318 RepID=A0A319DX77_ASPSB|nr:hypothetical protein BO78DRAFT_473056 [Aspergillus sclerotiicarbonarius CBS 121057]
MDQTGGSAPGASYWGRARKRLPPKTKEKLHKILEKVTSQEETLQDDTERGMTWPEQVLEACQKSKADYEQKQWKVSIGAREIAVHRLWDNAIGFLNKARGIVNVAASVDANANLGWSIAKLFLAIPVTKAKVASAAVEGISKVVIVMSRGLVYEHEIRQSQDGYHDVNMKNFEESLVKLYERVLTFQVLISEHYEKGSLHRTWDSIWNSDVVTAFDKDTVQLQLDLEQEAAANSRIRSQDGFNRILESNMELRKQLLKLIGQIEDAKRRQEILAWFSNVPYEDQHDEAKKGLAKGTGRWVFQRPEFESWQTSRKRRILWLNGIPGAGKTKIMSVVIEKFKEEVSSGTAPEGKSGPATDQIAFFYCRRYEESRRDAITILRSLAKQLATLCDPLPKSMERLYNVKGKEGSASRIIHIKQIQKILKKAIEMNGNVVVFLDALDECSEESKKDLLKTFKRLLKLCHGLKVIISSRDQRIIHTRLEKYPTISVTATDNKDDIDGFVRQQIESFMNSKDHGDVVKKSVQELEGRIIDTFLEKSEGMFQWAAMHMAHILSQKNKAGILAALTQLPKGLEDTYSGLMSQIKSETSGESASRAFCWLQAAGGTCKTSVLVAAVSIGIEQGDNADLEDQIQDIDSILGPCQNLMVVEGDSVRFSHLSVQEYFESSEARVKECQVFAATICLRTLLYYDYRIDLWEDGLPIDLSDYSNHDRMGTRSSLDDLWEYAYEHWWTYTTLALPDNNVKQLVEDFADQEPPSRGFTRWLLHLSRDSTAALIECCERAIAGSSTEWGDVDKLLEFIFAPQLWLSPSRHMEINTRRHIREGEYVILQHLVTACLSKVKSMAPVSPSEWYSQAKKSTGIRKLEKRGVEMENSGNLAEGVCQIYQNIDPKANTFMLISALATGLFLVVLWHALPRQRARSLQWAGAPCHKTAINIDDLKITLRIFIDALSLPYTGVASDSQYTPLVNCVRLLPFFNNPDARYREEMAMFTLVLLAVMHWGSPFNLNHALVTTNGFVYHLPFIKWLVHNGADVNFTPDKDGIGRGSPLIAALVNTFEYDTSIAGFLLEKGADINLPAGVGRYDNALTAAIRQGEESKVQFLLSNPDIDINAKLGPDTEATDGTPLIAACRIGNPRMVKLLLEQPKLQVNLQASGGKYGTALIAACGEHEVAITRLLVDHPNIDVNKQSSVGDFGTALIAACGAEYDERNKTQDRSANSIKPIDILLSTALIDVHATTPHGRYGSALVAACLINDVDHVKKILSRAKSPRQNQESYRWPPPKHFLEKINLKIIIMLVIAQDPVIDQLRADVSQNTTLGDDIGSSLIDRWDKKKSSSGAIQLLQAALKLEIIEIETGIFLDINSDALDILAERVADPEGSFWQARNYLDRLGFPDPSTLTTQYLQRWFLACPVILETEGWGAVSKWFFALVRRFEFRETQLPTDVNWEFLLDVLNSYRLEEEEHSPSDQEEEVDHGNRGESADTGDESSDEDDGSGDDENDSSDTDSSD